MKIVLTQESKSSPIWSITEESFLFRTVAIWSDMLTEIQIGGTISMCVYKIKKNKKRGMQNDNVSICMLLRVWPYFKMELKLHYRTLKACYWFLMAQRQRRCVFLVYHAAAEPLPDWRKYSWCQQEAGWSLWWASGRKRCPKPSASVHVHALCKTALQTTQDVNSSWQVFAHFSIKHIWQQLELDPSKCCIFVFSSTHYILYTVVF